MARSTLTLFICMSIVIGPGITAARLAWRWRPSGLRSMRISACLRRTCQSKRNGIWRMGGAGVARWFSLSRYPDVDGPREIAMLQQAYRDIALTSKFLFDASVALAHIDELGVCVGNALADIDLSWYAGNDVDAPVLDPHPVAGERLSGGGNHLSGLYRGEHFTTRLLFECAATIDQILGCLNYDEGISVWASRIDDVRRSAVATLESSSYGMPVRIFLDFYHRQNTSTLAVDDTDMLATVAVLCDIALNPAIPPFVPHESMKQPIQWEDVYPPVRFIWAVKLCAGMDLLAADSDTDEIETFVREICRLGKWRAHVDLDPPVKRLPGDPAPRSTSSHIGLYRVINPREYQLILQDAQTALWNVRLEDSGRLSMYGRNAQWMKSGHSSIGQAVQTLGSDYLLAPFTWYLDDRFLPRDPPGVDVGVSYCVSLAASLALDEAMTGVGPLKSQRHLPPRACHSETWRQICAMIEDDCEMAIWNS